MLLFLATYLQSGEEEPKAVGLEMFEAEQCGGKMPLVVKTQARDSESLKGLKKLIVAMTDCDPKKRMSLSNVLGELEKLATGTIIVFLI